MLDIIKALFNRKLHYQPEGLLLGILSIFILMPIIRVPTEWFAEIGGVGTVILLSGWFWIRRCPSFSSKRIGILFCTYGEPELDKEIEALEQAVIAELINQSLENEFVLKKMPPNRRILDISAAHRYRDRTKAILIVWGHYDEGFLKGQKVKGFRPGNLNFTYQTPAQETFKTVFQAEVRQVIRDRRWMIGTKNDFVERNFVSHNIAQVSAYIISLCLMVFGKHRQAGLLLDTVLRNLHGKWEGKNAGVSRRNFVAKVNLRASEAYLMAAGRIYRERLFNGDTFQPNQADLSEAFALIQSSLSRKPIGQAYLIKAIFDFLNGDIKGAKRSALKAKKISGRFGNAPYYSLGFLNAFDGNLEQGVKFYRAGIKLTLEAQPDFIFHLVQFVNAVVKRDPHRYHLHYILGLLNKELLDPSVAVEEFETFIAMNTRTKGDVTWTAKAKLEIET